MPLHTDLQTSNEAVTPVESDSPRVAFAYHALMIRYWREELGGGWRFMVQDVSTGEQYGFAEVDLLLAFLHQRMGGSDKIPHSQSLPEQE